MKTTKEAYEAGYACGIHGADIVNSNYVFFATFELTEAHSQGVEDAESGLKNKYQ